MIDLGKIALFLIYFGTSAVLLAAFLAAYTLITPIKEWELIRAGNRAVALSLGGAMLGFTLPLATAIALTHGLTDMIITAAIASVVQLICFEAVHLLRRDARAKLEQGDVAEGILRAFMAVTLGLLNAACLT